MQEIDKNAIIERIKQLRDNFAGGRGKSKFAAALGISPSTYNYYENNRIPPIEILLKICEITNTDLNWLITGQFSRKSENCNEKAYRAGPESELLNKTHDLLKQFPDLAEPIGAFIELLYEKKGIENKQQGRLNYPEQERPAWIPVLGRTAAGIVHFWDNQNIPEAEQAVTELDEIVKKYVGKEIVSFKDASVSVDLQTKELLGNLKKTRANLIQITGAQEDIVEFVQCEQIHSLFSDSFALRIDGDSMSPRINDGDIVILSPSVPAEQGQIGIIRLRNQIGVTCKLIRTTDGDIHLIPINEKYETKVLHKKDVLWALAVLCHISL